MRNRDAKRLEGISKPSNYDKHTGKLNKSMKEVGLVFVTSDQAAEILQPTDRTFDFPAFAISPKLATILGRRPGAIAAVRADEINASPLQSGPQGVAVSGEVINQARRIATKNFVRNQRFDQGYFVGAGACRVGSSGKSFCVGENHDLCALASLGLPDLFTPFFAGEKVPSAIASSWFTQPSRSSNRTNRAQAFFPTPLSVHSLCRRQQVAAEGNRSGMSDHRAPLRRIQMMPSTQGRAATGGRPPFGPTGRSGNKFEINDHCSSVSSYLGSVVDPAGDSTAKRDRFVMSASFRLHSLRKAG